MKKNIYIIILCATVIVTVFITYCVCEFVHLNNWMDSNMFNAELMAIRQLDFVIDAYKKEKYEIALYEIEKFNSLLTESPYAYALPETQSIYYNTLMTAMEYKVKKQQPGTDANDIKSTYDKLLSNIEKLNACLFPNADAKDKADPDKIGRTLEKLINKKP